MADAASAASNRDACLAPDASRHHGLRVIVDWVKLVWCGMNASRTLGLAAEMSFRLFFSLLPLAAVGGLVLARLTVSHGDLGATMLASTPPAVRDLVAAQLGLVAKWNGGAVAPLAAVVFVWLASSGIHSVFDALEVEGGLARPWWKKRLIALGTCVGLSFGVAVLALLRTGLGWLFRLAGANLPHALTFWEGSWFLAVVRVVFGLLIAFGLVAGLYAAGMPRVRHRYVVIVPGALLAVSLQAAADAKDTLGVWRVRDRVAVQPVGNPTDADIEAGSKRMLAEDPLLSDGKSIQVSTVKGKVALTGTIASGFDRLEAVDDVETVPGVSEVDDALAVKLPPADIKGNIEDRLFWDPMVERDLVTVAVAPDGVATLTGTLNGWSKIKASGEDAVLGGARRVVNLLKLQKHPEVVAH